jgi:hypothetical protein
MFFLQCFSESVETIQTIRKVQFSGDDRDLAMAKFNQMAGAIIGPAEVVTTTASPVNPGGTRSIRTIEKRL